MMFGVYKTNEKFKYSFGDISKIDDDKVIFKSNDEREVIAFYCGFCLKYRKIIDYHFVFIDYAIGDVLTTEFGRKYQLSADGLFYIAD